MISVMVLHPPYRYFVAFFLIMVNTGILLRKKYLYPMASPNIYLPIKLTQLAELIRSLPPKEKQQLASLLFQEDDGSLTVPESQKEFVRNSIKKYSKYPELLIAEKQAWKILDKKG
jgi:hypothetical protein